jgi:hypothetical protein
VLEGRAAEATDDLFGLASVAYVLLTGTHPFANRTATEARAEGLKPVRPRGLRARQWRALRQGLELRNGRRPADVGRWVRRLNAGAALRPLPMLCELYSVRPSRIRHSFAAAVAAVLVLSSAVGLWMAHVPASPPRFAATAWAQAAATFATARTSFVRIWNKTLRSAVIGSEAGTGPAGH